MKLYQGFYHDFHQKRIIEFIEINEKGNIVKREMLKHIIRHSPTGMNWGYGGSGAADASLSILTDAVGKRLAEEYYQEFKGDFIAPAGGFLIVSSTQIEEWFKKKGVTFYERENEEERF